jgi:small subunit ribosomal protein S3
MGQKINPKAFRIGVTKNWPTRWFFGAQGNVKSPTATSNIKSPITRSTGRYSYAKFLEEDELIRKAVKDKIGLAGIAGIEIERTSNNLRIFIKAARPGLIIGRGGKGIEDLTKLIESSLKKLRGARSHINLSVNVEELKRSEVSSAYLAQQVAWDLEKRMPYRRTIKKYLDQADQNKEVKGVKIMLSGRIGGAEIARRETLKKGSLPLQKLRADIDYGQATAFTTYGTIGIKVWIYKGDLFNNKDSR